MKQTAVQQRLINIAVQKAGNDSEAARQLGWLPKRFNHYRLGSRCADDDAIVDLARMAGEDPRKAVIEHRAEQAKTPQMRQFWLSFGKAAAAIMIAIGLSSALLPSDAFASQSPYSTHDFTHTKNYAKCKVGAGVYMKAKNKARQMAGFLFFPRVSWQSPESCFLRMAAPRPSPHRQT